MINLPGKAHAQDREQLGTIVVHIRKEKEDRTKEGTILQDTLPPIPVDLQPVQMLEVMLLLES